MDDEKFMALALEEARAAFDAGEVPIGAVVVKDGIVIARNHNRVENRKSVSAHAEFEAIRDAEKVLNDWRMSDCTLYVTKEPCPMCAGMLVNARIKRIVFGVSDILVINYTEDSQGGRLNRESYFHSNNLFLQNFRVNPKGK